MKKRVSLVLVAVILLSTAYLSGCSMDSNELLTPTEPSVRTTITEEEWQTALNAVNFTYNALDGVYRIHSKATASSVYQCVTDTSTNQTTSEFYLATIENVSYRISKTESGFVAEERSEYTAVKFGSIFYVTDTDRVIALNDTLIYNEETKSYQYEDADLTVDICFENGKIKSAHAVLLSENPQVVYEFYDFGTTVVDLPEFTYATTEGIEG